MDGKHRAANPPDKEAFFLSNSDKKGFLSQYGDNEREIKRLEEDMACWESRAERVTVTYSPVPTRGGTGDRLQTAVESILEVRAMLYERLIDASELRRAIQAAIDTVPDARLRTLLEYRYIDGRKWESIAEALCLDFRHTLRLHCRALAAVRL